MNPWILLAATLAMPQLQLRPITWSVTAPKSVAPGSTIPIGLVATIDDGWHLYSTTQGSGGPIPTRIAVVASPIFAEAGALGFPKPIVAADPNFGINVETYDRTVTFTVPVRVAANARPGVDTLAFQARFQACNANLCLPPKTQTISVPVTVR
jgi:DsbC/DsbD-like thiol-disulfide interchange protein